MAIKRKNIVSLLAGVFFLTGVQAAEPIGGVGGFKNIDRVKCKNRNTGQSVFIRPDAQAWSCEGAGLVVNAGDKVDVEIRGIAKGPVPYAPSIPTAAISNFNVVLAWPQIEGAVEYNVYGTTQPGVSVIADNLLGSSVSNSFVHNGVVDGQTYYYVVTAINGFGESDPSPELSVTVRLTFDHAGIVNGCFFCHVNDKGLTHLPSTQTCETCHDSTTSWLVVAYNHAGVNGNCTNCHSGEYSGVVGKPSGHLPTTQDCSTCHISTTNWLQVSSGGTLQIDAGGQYIGDTGVAIQFQAVVTSQYIGIPLTWSWIFGDGTMGDGIAPSHAYASAGVYLVTVSASNGSMTASSTAVVRVFDPISANGIATTF